MSLSMSNSGTDVLERQLNPVSSPTSVASFPLSQVSQWLVSIKSEIAALQFPDELLHLALAVSSRISSMVSTKVCVLGDTSFSDCCVDLVAAQHIGADALVHFTGKANQACLTPTNNSIRVKHVFMQSQFSHQNVQHLEDTLNQLVQNDCSEEMAGKTFLFYDLGLDDVMQSLRIESNLPIVLAKPDLEPDVNDEIDGQEEKRREVVIAGRLLPCLPSSKDSIVYIGYEGEERLPILLTLSFPFVQSLIHLRIRSEEEKLSFSRLDLRASARRALMKRMYLIERIKESKRIGLLVNTLAASKYNLMVDQALKMIKESQRRAYVFIVGKPNVAKMANFPEIDVFVHISCPLTSLFSDDDRNYLRPVVTPFELELALNKGRKEYNALVDGMVLDFKQVLPNARLWLPFQIEEEADISLISGRVRLENSKNIEDSNKNVEDYSNEEKETEIGIVSKQERSITQSNGGVHFLHSRSWQGLEPKLGQTDVVKAVKGRKGIAMGYENEGS